MKELLIIASIALLFGLGVWYFLLSTKPDPAISPQFQQLQEQKRSIETPPDQVIPEGIKDLKG